MLTDKQKLELLASIIETARELQTKLGQWHDAVPRGIFQSLNEHATSVRDMINIINEEGGIAYCIEANTEEDI